MYVAIEMGSCMIAVLDSQNHRIQIFSPDKEFLWAFGSKGNEGGQFQGPPIAFTLTPDGNFLVLEPNKAQMFDFQGNFLSMFAGDFSECFSMCPNPISLSVPTKKKFASLVG
jgi:hypothetical protein